MTPTELTNEFLKYSVTSDFRNNVYANMAAMVLEFGLLLVLLPLLIWAFKWPKRRRARAMAGFYTLQFLRETVLMLLRAGGMTDIKGSIENELNTVGSYEKHITYGNTPFLLELLKRRMKGGQHIEGHLKLTGEEIAALRMKSQSLLSTADQYAFLFASIEQPEYCEKFYEVRLILYALRDYFDDLTPIANNAFFPTDDIRGMSTGCAQFVDRWFLVEKRRVDRAISREHSFQFAIFILRGLRVLGYRMVIRPLCRIRRKPYIDPMACNVFQRLLSAVVDSVQLSPLQLGKHLNMTASEILSYSMGYRRPSYDDQVAILLKASALVPEAIWAGLVVSQVTADLDRRRPGVIEIESAKAGAIAWLSTLLSPERLQDPAIYDLRMKLFLMKPHR